MIFFGHSVLTCVAMSLVMVRRTTVLHPPNPSPVIPPPFHATVRPGRQSGKVVGFVWILYYYGILNCAEDPLDIVDSWIYRPRRLQSARQGVIIPFKSTTVQTITNRLRKLSSFDRRAP
jgi:hypothetical protein